MPLFFAPPVKTGAELDIAPPKANTFRRSPGGGRYVVCLANCLLTSLRKCSEVKRPSEERVSVNTMAMSRWNKEVIQGGTWEFPVFGTCCSGVCRERWDICVPTRLSLKHVVDVCAYHSTPFTSEWSVRKTSIAWSTLDAEPQTSPPPMVRLKRDGLVTAIFQQDNARPHVACIFQSFFINHQIELLPWSARSPDLSPIENMWSMVAQRLTQITPPAATPYQLWQRVEAAWSAVPQEHTQSLFKSMPRRVAVVISNNGGYSGY
ncbi:transposable element Tcb1 transposase [Trichonephila clavipes]|nr:transposable element Tcb1 transposase [Trichonephila clavipes]